MTNDIDLTASTPRSFTTWCPPSELLGPQVAPILPTPAYVLETIEPVNDTDLEAIAPRLYSTAWPTTAEQMEAQIAHMVQMEEERQQAEQDAAVVPDVVTALTASDLLNESKDESGGELSAEEQMTAVAFVLATDMSSNSSDGPDVFESDVEVSDEEGGS